jgi:hypothetical protein
MLPPVGPSVVGAHRQASAFTAHSIFHNYMGPSGGALEDAQVLASIDEL